MFFLDILSIELSFKTQAKYKVDVAELKSDIQTLERTEFVKLKNQNQTLRAEINKLLQNLREQTGRIQASTRLDLNLEKGRLFDEYSELQAKLKETEMKLQQEINSCRAPLQQIKFDTLRTLLTTASTVGLVVLGYMRLFK